MAAESDDLVYAIVEAVAEREGVDPKELPPLGTVVDPDALKDLFRDGENLAGGSRVRVQIEYCEYAVEVTGDGSVTLSPVQRTST